MAIVIAGGEPVVSFGSDDLDLSNLTPPTPTPPTEIPLGTSAAAVNALIAGATVGEAFEFAAGTHSFSEKIVVQRDYVSLKGSAAVLDFTLASGNSIEVKGGGTSDQFTLGVSVDKGQFGVFLPNGHSFSGGDTIYLREPNTQAYLDENGWTNVSLVEVANSPFRESIHQIVTIQGNLAVLATPVPFSYAAGTAQGYKITLRNGVLLEGFEVTHASLGVPDHDNFDNPLPAFEGAAAILARDVGACVVRGVTITNAPSSGLVVESALGFHVNGLTVDGAHNKGGGTGGNGYGLELHETFGCFTTNLTLLNGRHAFIFSAFHAEIGNTIHILDANRDINFHGSPDFDNVIRVDNMELTYGPTKNPSNRTDVSRTVNPGGTNHPLTDFVSVNTITFKAAKGSYREDYLRADEGGSILEGGFDADEYILADGVDKIIINVGDRADTVENFQWGATGDEVEWRGIVLGDLVVTADPEGSLVTYGAQDSVLFKGVSPVEIDFSNFSFV